MEELVIPGVTLSILVVNFNGKPFLDDCLASIKQHVPVPYEVVIVDNASQDGSVEHIRQNYPEVHLIASPNNLGFTSGNNLAARSASGHYLLLLNNDTAFRSSIAPLLEQMRADAHIGVIGCRLLYGNGKLQESVGYMPSVLSLALSWTPLAYLFPQSHLFRRTICAASALYRHVYHDVAWVSGACLLTRAGLWHQLGGLDERYFMYMEDIDYCRRVRAAGYVVAYSASCEVTHFEGAGRAWIGERAVLNTTDSYLIYAKKYYGMWGGFFMRLLLAPVFFARALGHGALGVVKMDVNGFDKAQAFGRATLKLIGAT